ncbi:MAG: indolepyruvate oxidoreductase subunit beta [Anaerolineae bacterium]|nr:indolepyruvate oxidoreductase subunit beta [Anaerolineae bacterium]
MNPIKFDPKAAPVNFLLTGVGGQGTILASNVIAEVGIGAGLDAKQAEVHGMSQRGGSVTSQVRWAPKVFSPLIAKGDSDILIAFEKLEAVRFIDYIKPGGLALINDHCIAPITVSAGNAEYPDDQTIHATIARYTSNAYWVQGQKIALELGNPRVTNVVLLGALSAFITLPEEQWLQAIARRVPEKHLALNKKAFEMGRKEIQFSQNP